MPFESQAQRAYFYAHPNLHKYIPEFNAATPKGPLPQHVGDRMLPGIPMQGGASSAMSRGGGGNPVQDLRNAIDAVHQAALSADDNVDRQTLLQCLAKIQSILATEQKERESALGTTPAHKFVAKTTARGGGY